MFGVLIQKLWVFIVAPYADPNILVLQDRGLGFRFEGLFKFRFGDVGFRVGV